MATANGRNSTLDALIRINDESKDATPSHSIAGSDNGFRQPYYMSYGAWLVIIQVMFQNEKTSPFETEEGFFLKTSPAALCISILVSEILLYTKKKNLIFPKMVKILTIVVRFSGTLAHLSLMLVIFISSELNWVRYLIISGLFVLMVVYTFHNDMIGLGKKMCDDIWERIKEFKEVKASSSSKTTILPV